MKQGDDLRERISPSLCDYFMSGVKIGQAHCEDTMIFPQIRDNRREAGELIIGESRERYDYRRRIWVAALDERKKIHKSCTGHGHGTPPKNEKKRHGTAVVKTRNH